MTCDRCYQPLDIGAHGLGLCPLEPRRRVAPFVRPDSIPGGLEIAHGLCNADGTPKRYDSWTEIRAAAKAKNLIPYHEVYVEDGNPRLKDARVHDGWLQSSEAKRERAGREELRAQKRERAGARR